MVYGLNTAVTAAVPCVLSRARAVILGGSAPRPSHSIARHKITATRGQLCETQPTTQSPIAQDARSLSFRSVRM